MSTNFWKPSLRNNGTGSHIPSPSSLTQWIHSWCTLERWQETQEDWQTSHDTVKLILHEERDTLQWCSRCGIWSRQWRRYEEEQRVFSCSWCISWWHWLFVKNISSFIKIDCDQSKQYFICFWLKSTNVTTGQFEQFTLVCQQFSKIMQISKVFSFCFYFFHLLTSISIVLTGFNLRPTA